MNARLVIGPLNYSSWSARPWLALTHAGLQFTTHQIDLFVDPKWRQKVEQFSGAAKVPILIHGSLSVHESLAICEYAAELAPRAGLWPEQTELRARARAICCEMATGFGALRAELPMNVRARTSAFAASEAVQREVARVFDIWSASLQSSGGPYLFGKFGIADCFFAPIVSRLLTYGIELSKDVTGYAQALSEVSAVQQWQELSRRDPALPAYDAKLQGA